MSNPAPGFAKHPTHEVQIAPTNVRVRVTAGEALVAETTRALEVRESRYPPVFYIPMEDVDRSLLTRTRTSTYCPFKGTASYWQIDTAANGPTDAAWGYEQPFDE